MLEIVISALVLSAIYGLVAIGISVTWSTLGMLNLSHGAAFVAAGYGAWWVSENISDAPVVVAIAGLVTGALTGLVVYLLAYRPLASKPNFSNRRLIATLALSLLATQAFLSLFGPRVKAIPKLFGRERLEIESIGLVLPMSQVGIIVSATLLLAVVVFILQRTRLGLQTRAIMQNPEGAALVGINRETLALGVLVMSGMMVGLASVLLGQTFFVSPDSGVQPLVKGLIAALLGGLGSVPGSVIAAGMVGFTEALTVEFFGAQYVIMAQLILVVLMLVFRPRGIAGVIEGVRE
jgi:branched-chain amino acid transport system permease protein